MKTLSFECSAKAASAAIMDDDRLLGMYFQNNGLTHSRTLLPMAEDLLKNAGISMEEIDRFAVSAGPGSFTGIRIGVSTIKGLCWGTEKPCTGVSTLEAMAWNAQGQSENSVICCCMDARRNQVYNALFVMKDGIPQRICADRAISLLELSEEAEKSGKHYYILGDGGELCYRFFSEKKINCTLAPLQIRFQNACGVGLAAIGKEAVPGKDLLPVYLRLSQAERERLERINNK